MKLAVISAALAVSACASDLPSGVPDLEVQLVEATCTHWCATKHPACAFTGAIVEPKTEPLRACQKRYITCVRSCPPR